MRIGRVRTVAGLQWATEDGGEVRALLAGPFDDAAQVGEPLGRLPDLMPAAPTAPTKIVCVGRNYVEHAAEHGADVPSEPLLFLKPPSAVIGPGETIVLPGVSRQVEHECELALVIGSRCRNVRPDRAWEHVLGVTCANDVTARDLQRADSQWTRGKGFDTFCPLGPWIVTGLGEDDISDLEVSCRVNGEPCQQGKVSQMVFSPASLVAYISRVMTLEPGDVVLTGTPAGVGPLRPGDEVTVEIPGIGSLTNPVAAG